MKAWKRSAAIGVAEIAVLLLLHVVLLHLMAEKGVVSTILAAGKHVPRGTLMLAGFFILVRVFAVFLLPGMVLARTGVTLFDMRFPPTSARRLSENATQSHCM